MVEDCKVIPATTCSGPIFNCQPLISKVCANKCIIKYPPGPTTNPPGDPFEETFLKSSNNCTKVCQNNPECLNIDIDTPTIGKFSSNNIPKFCSSTPAITKIGEKKWRTNDKYKSMCACFYPTEYYNDMKDNLKESLGLKSTDLNFGFPSCWYKDCRERDNFNGSMFTTSNDWSNPGSCDSTNSLDQSRCDSVIGNHLPTTTDKNNCLIKGLVDCVNVNTVNIDNSIVDTIVVKQTNNCRDMLGIPPADTSDNTIVIVFISIISVIIIFIIGVLKYF